MKARGLVPLAPLVALVGVACSDSGRAPGFGTNADSTELPEVIDISGMPRGHILLESTPEFVVGSITGSALDGFTAVVDGVRTPRGAFVILDRDRATSRLVVLDRAGRVLRELGRHGDGPGEFRYPTALFVDGLGDVGVWDAQRGRLTLYRTTGEVASEFWLPFEARAVTQLGVNAGKYVAVVEENPPNPSYGRQDNTAKLMRAAPNDQSPEVLASFPGLSWRRTAVPGGIRLDRPWYYPRLKTAFNAYGLWTATGLDWVLSLRGADHGRVVKRIRLRNHQAPFPADSVEELLPDAPELRPPIADLLADRGGRVWVGLRDLPIETLPSGMGEVVSNWIVLDVDGETVLGEVGLPRGRRLLDVDSDGVLTVTSEGGVDTPIVEWWEFRFEGALAGR